MKKWFAIAALTLACQNVRAEVSYGTNVAQVTAGGALKVDGSAVTQPVSGSLTIAASTVTSPVQVLQSTVGVVSASPLTVVSTGIPVSLSAPVTIVSTGIPVTGTFWQTTQPTYQTNPSTVTFNGVAQPVTSTSTYVVNPSTVTFNGVAQPVTSTFTVVYNSTVGVVQMPITKGTQGTTGVTTQDLKDAGRTYVVFVATAVAGVTSEALFSFDLSKQGAVTHSTTSYTVTNNKTLRLQGMYCSNRAGAAAVSFTRATLRHNTAGATVATSPLVASFEVGISTGVINNTAYGNAPFPDGIEIRGDGTQSIGVTHLDQATTNLVTCTLVGYEY